VARTKAEDSKVSMRNIRRAAKEAIEKLEKDGHIGKDDLARGEKELEKMIKDIQNQFNLLHDNISYLILHQANKTIIDIINEETKFSDKSLVSISDFGNTSSASIPITICHNKKSLENKNINCLLVGFGVGLSWSSCQINFSNTNINDIIYY
jgi:3-oxoacyl-[acyl-carrier-protein] synthase III